MTIVVTGSAGHLGEALMRKLRARGLEARGVDILASPFTTAVGSIADRAFVERSLDGVDVVMHAATLHKPHVATHSRQDFVDVNITGTLNLLEAAVAQGVNAFVFTSTTSIYGRALNPGAGGVAVWVTEALAPVPKNIYGVTKFAAENLCRLMHDKCGLPCIVLRTSRFFPEDDDDKEIRAMFDQANAKANEFLYRRVDIEDAAEAHLLAMEKASSIGFGRYIISATTPFGQDDLQALTDDAPAVVRRHFREFDRLYKQRGWKMFPSLKRVYVNERARRELGWRPKYDFAEVLRQLGCGEKTSGSDMARAVGVKGYHAQVFENEPYPVDEE